MASETWISVADTASPPSSSCAREAIPEGALMRLGNVFFGFLLGTAIGAMVLNVLGGLSVIPSLLLGGLASALFIIVRRVK